MEWHLVDPIQRKPRLTRNIFEEHLDMPWPEDHERQRVADQDTANGTYVHDVASGRITRAALRDGDAVIAGLG